MAVSEADKASGHVVKPVVYFVLGCPGAGKGTQCLRLAKECDFVHISAGDCLREEMSDETSEYKVLIDKYIREGGIVPVEITVALLKKKMENSGWAAHKYLIDGFPRNQNNYEGWAKIMGDIVDARACLFLDCPEDVSVSRIQKRSETSGRTDDNVVSIKKRFQTFQNETMPIVEIFKAQGKCINVKADRDVEDVWTDVCHIMTTTTTTTTTA